MATEDKFPTLRDLRDGLSRLIDEGMGDLAAQIIIVPDSTLQAVAKVTGAPGWNAQTDKAKLIEFDGVDGRLPMMMLTADYVNGKDMPSRRSQ